MARLDHEKNNRKIKFNKDYENSRKNIKAPKQRKYCSKFEGTCYLCGKLYYVGQFTIYDFDRKAGRHENCEEDFKKPVPHVVPSREIKGGIPMVSKYTGSCYICKSRINKGSSIVFEPTEKKARHELCFRT